MSSETIRDLSGDSGKETHDISLDLTPLIVRRRRHVVGADLSELKNHD